MCKTLKRAGAIVTAMVAIASASFTSRAVHAQSTQPSAAVAQSTAPRSDDLIQLNFQDNVNLKVFVQYVSERLAMNILYDDQLVEQTITIRSPAPIPKNSLLGLLESVLQAKGLLLIDAEQPGWKRIVQNTNLAAAAKPSTQPIGARSSASQPAAAAATALTQVFSLAFADPVRAEQVVKPFLSQPGGSSVPLPELHLLIVTDYASNVQRIAKLVSLVDQPQRKVATKFIPAKSVDAQSLGQQLTSLLAARARAEGTAAATPLVEVAVDPRSNQLILIGPEDSISAAADLVRSIDVPFDRATQTYRFQFVSPERIDRLVKGLLTATDSKRSYSSAVDVDSGLLIATATDEVHQQIAALKKQLDVAGGVQEQSPIRFYKLENTTATDVLQTLMAISNEEGMPSVNVEGLGARQRGINGASSPQISGTIGGAQQVQLAPPPMGMTAPTASSTMGQREGETDAVAPAARDGQDPYEGRRSPSSAGAATSKPKDATITADPNTNTIIVIAKPEVQRIYEQLIRTLDKRRPQVLIECTIVSLDTTRNYSLGVEIASRGGSGSTDVITFSSFGLSKVGTTPGDKGDLGRLTLNPGLGFNGTLIQSDVAQLVIKALLTSGRAEVVSAPRILVNDNATGQLSSVQEAPFTSINASNTVATTGFAGYASAGTTIAVTPHISEGDFLQLEYNVALNSFTGEPGTSGTPPPRQTNQLQSKVAVPDGSTIIVGGLNRKNLSDTVDAVPILGEIPVLKYLFSSRDKKESSSTLFVFIRPVVLRDDKFADLKFFSAREVEAAGLKSDFPKSHPLLVK